MSLSRGVVVYWGLGAVSERGRKTDSVGKYSFKGVFLKNKQTTAKPSPAFQYPQLDYVFNNRVCLSPLLEVNTLSLIPNLGSCFAGPGYCGFPHLPAHRTGGGGDPANLPLPQNWSYGPVLNRA